MLLFHWVLDTIYNMAQQRDERGRFVKGNDKSFDQRTPEEQRNIAVMGGKASGESRRNRRTIAEVMRKVLDEPMGDTDLTRLDGVVQSTLQNFYKKPSMKGLKILAEILGELEQNVNLKTNDDKPVINIISKKSGE